MFEKLKGFRDFYQEEMRSRRKLFDVMHEIARGFGFEEVDAPSLERLELFKKKSGDELLSQLFSFKDRGGRDVTLIPELTPTLARMLINRKDLPRPVKWYSIPKLWRYEEPQSGRLREFYQFNADIFGSKSIYADVNIISLASTILDALGLHNRYVIKISDRRLVSSIITGMGIEPSYALYRIIDKMERLSQDEILSMLVGAGLSESDSESLISMLKNSKIQDVLPEAGSELETELNLLMDSFDNMNIQYRFDLSLVRGLAYYTGLVFEAHDVEGKFRAILGGGRYDEIINLFGGQPTPAVGFGVGDAVLELIMRDAGVWPDAPRQVDFYIAVQDHRYYYKAISLLKSLVLEGYSCDIDVMGRSLGRQMKHAHLVGARRVLFITDKINAGQVELRDMASGEQSVVSVDEVTQKALQHRKS